MLKLNSQSPLGIGVAPQDVDALKEAILTLLNNSDYANQCGNNAHKHVLENYTMSKVWQQLESIWMDLKAS
jgi:glycosyltransferase involved in cell wall biosynthesis